MDGRAVLRLLAIMQVSRLWTGLSRRQLIAELAASAAVGLSVAAMLRASLPGERSLRIVGSRELADPIRRWAAMFERLYPGATVHALPYGSGVAMNEMAEGRADIVPLARPASDDERAMFAGPAPIAVPVARRAENGEAIMLYLAPGMSLPRDATISAFVHLALSAEGQRVLAGSGFRTLSPNERDEAAAQIISLRDRDLNFE